MPTLASLRAVEPEEESKPACCPHCGQVIGGSKVKVSVKGLDIILPGNHAALVKRMLSEQGRVIAESELCRVSGLSHSSLRIILSIINKKLAPLGVRIVSVAKRGLVLVETEGTP